MDSENVINWLKTIAKHAIEDGYDALRANTVVIDGRIYIAEEPKVKTVHGKTGEVIIGGFKEVQDADSD